MPLRAYALWHGGPMTNDASDPRPSMSLAAYLRENPLRSFPPRYSRAQRARSRTAEILGWISAVVPVGAALLSLALFPFLGITTFLFLVLILATSVIWGALGLVALLLTIRAGDRGRIVAVIGIVEAALLVAIGIAIIRPV